MLLAESSANLGLGGFILLAAVIVVACVIGNRLDRARITEHIQRAGGSVQRITWQPFGRGWFGENRERLYEVCYRTRAGETITATCKTSMMTGVFWSSDTPPASFNHSPPVQTRCRKCGAPIPKGQTECAPRCAVEEARVPSGGSP